MNRLKQFFWTLVIGLFVAGELHNMVAWAQTVVDQGQPGTQGPWPVTLSASLGDGGTSTNGSHGACTNWTMNVGTSSVPCPGDGGTSGSVARSSRASILIELVQTGETLTITSDGTAASATAGIAISSGGTYYDNLSGSAVTNCRCTAATCSVRTTECP